LPALYIQPLQTFKAIPRIVLWSFLPIVLHRVAFIGYPHRWVRAKAAEMMSHNGLQGEALANQILGDPII
jgi:hypothetical protein